MRRKLAVGAAVVVAAVASAGPALACGGLVGENGSIQLLRTSTLAAYTDGIEHYVTSFEFAGGGAELGSIVPLPGVPTEVERGGAWTLQRLALEVAPPVEFAAADSVAAGGAPAPAEVLLETRIDALDITILRGGGTAVGDWARENGFRLTPDAPEVLDFYADRSPIFMAARFDATAAAESGQQIGDGTPIHLTIPTSNPWVPLRILSLGLDPDETVEADVFLLTDREPALLGGVGDELVLEQSRPASDSLLADLRSDDGMGWVPEDMWLSFLRVDSTAGDLTFDLAVDASGNEDPSPIAAGLFDELAGETPAAPDVDDGFPWVLAVFGAGTTGLFVTLTVTGWRDRRRTS